MKANSVIAKIWNFLCANKEYYCCMFSGGKVTRETLKLLKCFKKPYTHTRTRAHTHTYIRVCIYSCPRWKYIFMLVRMYEAIWYLVIKTRKTNSLCFFLTPCTYKITHESIILFDNLSSNEVELNSMIGLKKKNPIGYCTILDNHMFIN